MSEYCYSTDLDRCVFSADTFSTREEAVKVGREEAIQKKYDTFCVGKTNPITTGDIVNADRILDYARQEILDLVGDDLADGWRDQIPEGKVKEFDDYLKKWFVDNKFEPNCFYVTDEEEHKV